MIQSITVKGLECHSAVIQSAYDDLPENFSAEDFKTRLRGLGVPRSTENEQHYAHRVADRTMQRLQKLNISEFDKECRLWRKKQQ